MMNFRELPKLRDSLSFVYLEHAKIERDGNALTAFDKTGETHLPVAALGVLLLGPGTSVSHEAVKVATENGCSLVWVGEAGVRLYAQGIGETRSAVRMLRQARLHADPATRMAVVLKMYSMRFAEALPEGLTLEQIRGREGVRVRTAYARASERTGVEWRGRQYDRGNWAAADPVNRALSAASACLNGVCHCAIVSAGYSSALGFLHTGKMLSFVYDVADLYRVDVIVPIAFEAAAAQIEGATAGSLERTVRTACRDGFRQAKLLERVVNDIDELMQVTPIEVERAQGLLDGTDDAPGGLWDPESGEVGGGINHGPDDP